MVDCRRVLLVDDDIDFVAINRQALEAAGFEVVVAHDGKQGFELATEGSVAVAVLDVIMSTPDEGFELARRLRNNTRTAKIPLIMLTSVNAVNEAKGHVFRLGDQDRDDMWLPVDKFVDKPVKPAALVAMVTELVG